MVWPDYIAGQRLFIAGVEQSPRRAAWNLVSGVTAAFNPATNMWDLTAAGGGGSGHTIQDEGSSLTQRSTMNFVGVNVTVTDAGGKTVVTIGQVSLTAGVTGTLPFTSGGTGLGALGTALQSLRVNAGATAPVLHADRWYPGCRAARFGALFTFSATTADADPGAGIIRLNNATPAGVARSSSTTSISGTTSIVAWLATFDDNVGTIKGRVTVRSISDPTKKLVFNITAYTAASGYGKLTVAHVFGTALPTTTAGDTFLSFDSGPVGGITNTEVATAAAIVLSKLADGSACSVVSRSANSSGAHADVASTTVGHVLRIGAGPVLGWGSLDLADSDTVGSTVLGVANGGDGILWNQGTNGANSNTTYNISDGNYFLVPASTISAGTKDYTWAYSGTPVEGEVVVFDVLGQSSDLRFIDSTIGTGTPIATVSAGATKWRLALQYNGASWVRSFRRRYP
jgi:hypothetical protein